MKCVFTITDANKEYLELAKTLIMSAKLNSDTDFLCIYDGLENEFTSWLRKQNVPYYKWRVPFFNEIKEKYTGKRSFDFCAGTYLRIEIPNVFDFYGIKEDYILFIDVDTLILDTIDLTDIKPKCFAGPPDWNISIWSPVSTGVMLINVKNLKDEYKYLVEHLINNNFDFDYAGVGPCSQGAWNTYFKDRWEKLDPDYDWKPWWGFNPKAKIVHFSGPKPNEIEIILSGKRNKRDESELEQIHRSVIERDKKSYTKYLKIWQKFYKLI